VFDSSCHRSRTDSYGKNFRSMMEVQGAIIGFQEFEYYLRLKFVVKSPLRTSLFYFQSDPILNSHP